MCIREDGLINKLKKKKGYAAVEFSCIQVCVCVGGGGGGGVRPSPPHLFLGGNFYTFAI